MCEKCFWYFSLKRLVVRTHITLPTWGHTERKIVSYPDLESKMSVLAHIELGEVPVEADTMYNSDLSVQTLRTRSTALKRLLIIDASA